MCSKMPLGSCVTTACSSYIPALVRTALSSSVCFASSWMPSVYSRLAVDHSHRWRHFCLPSRHVTSRQWPVTCDVDLQFEGLGGQGCRRNGHLIGHVALQSRRPSPSASDQAWFHTLLHLSQVADYFVRSFKGEKTRFWGFDGKVGHVTSRQSHSHDDVIGDYAVDKRHKRVGLWIQQHILATSSHHFVATRIALSFLSLGVSPGAVLTYVSLQVYICT